MTSKKTPTPKPPTTGRYRILCRSLSYPTSREVIDRILAGDHSEEARAARNADTEVHFEGEVVDNLAPETVKVELEAGNIEEVK